MIEQSNTVPSVPAFTRTSTQTLIAKTPAYAIYNVFTDR